MKSAMVVMVMLLIPSGQKWCQHFSECRSMFTRYSLSITFILSEYYVHTQWVLLTLLFDGDHWLLRREGESNCLRPEHTSIENEDISIENESTSFENEAILIENENTLIENEDILIENENTLIE